MSAQTVSILIPCWNAERYVAQAVASALGQSWPAVEVIVVDDGSTDGSRAVLEAFGDRIRLIATPNQGAWKARNTALQAAQGTFVKYLDADDLLFPNTVEQQVRAAQNLPDTAFVYGRIYRLEQTTGRLHPHSARDRRANNHDGLTDLLIDVPVTTAPLYRKAQLQTLGGFREGVVLRDDFDLFVRAVLAGFDPVGDPSPVYCYRDHDDTARLSRRASAADYAGLVSMYEHHLSLLAARSASDATQQIAVGLAKSMWITGRNALRLGYRDSAAHLFKMATQCAPDQAVYGRWPYQLLTRALGPFRAEAALAMVRKGGRRR